MVQDRGGSLSVLKKGSEEIYDTRDDDGKITHFVQLCALCALRGRLNNCV